MSRIATSTRPSRRTRGERVRRPEPTVVFCLRGPAGQVETVRPGQRPSWAR